jgi:hypothetical protein
LTERLVHRRLSPDFQNMDFQSAVKDLKKRIANYEAVYESLDEDEKDPKGNSVSFIKVINLSSKVIANNIHGKIARSVLTFLMNLHIMQRPIFLVRAPHPDGATEQNWQIQGNEPTFPNVCTNVISEAVGAVADPDVGGQVGACKVPRIAFADERKSTLHICAEVRRTGTRQIPTILMQSKLCAFCLEVARPRNHERS